MTLALPVYHPQQPGHVLLQPDYPLTRRMIDRVREFGVQEVWVRYPSLSAVEKFVNPELLRRRGELAASVGQVFQASQNQAFANVDYQTYTRAFYEMINTLLANPATVLYLDQLGSTDKPLMDHCLRVSFLSVLMGVKLDGYLVAQRWRINPQRAKNVTNLGLGAMLHDIGKLSLEPEVLQRHDEIGNDDDPSWQAHVRIGFDLLHNKVPATATNVVLQHHQHWDGSGFPKLLTAEGKRTTLVGEQIHIYARIACVANEFDRLHHPKGTGRIPTVAAMHRLLATPYINWFDPNVVQALIAVVPPFAPGTIVHLNNGQRAVPIQHHPATPCRPTVQLLDTQATPGTDEAYIDLREHDEMYIRESEGHDVSAYHFDAPPIPVPNKTTG